MFLQGLAAVERGDLARAAALSVAARAAAGSSEELLIQHSGPLLILANIAVSRGDHDAAQRLYDESIDASRRTGEAWSLGILLSAAAGLRIVRGELAPAHAQASEALSICQELEDPRGIAWSLDVFAACSPPADAATKPRGRGARRTGCSRAWAGGCRRKSDGSGLAISSPRERRSAPKPLTRPAPQAARCRCRTRSRARASRPAICARKSPMD